MELTVDPLSEEDALLDLTRRANDGKLRRLTHLLAACVDKFGVGRSA